LPEPVYTWEEGEPWERGGLYKGCLIEEKGIYYLFYNAKNETFSYWKEQTGVAMSSDMFNWKRYEVIPLLRVSDESWNSKFCSDPYVVKDNIKFPWFLLKPWVVVYIIMLQNTAALILTPISLY
jgi:sucrose-6-phosphate hydrolase SacC (GH32 family)